MTVATSALDGSEVVTFTASFGVLMVAGSILSAKGPLGPSSVGLTIDTIPYERDWKPV